MTADDDAFLRTIVDHPGQDVPRLVYADWLDDRDDPRGPFLRAEVEWAQPWKDGTPPDDNAELRAMAANLDPLWVARVARPPLGVCADHITLTNVGPALSVAELDAVEARLRAVQSGAREQIRAASAEREAEPYAEFFIRLGMWREFQLPTEVRAFLLNHNGGIPAAATFSRLTHNRTTRQSRIDRFLSTGSVVVVPGWRDGRSLETFTTDCWIPDQEDIWEFSLRRIGIARVDDDDGSLWVHADGDFKGIVSYGSISQDSTDEFPLASTLADFFASVSG